MKCGQISTKEWLKYCDKNKNLIFINMKTETLNRIQSLDSLQKWFSPEIAFQKKVISNRVENILKNKEKPIVSSNVDLTREIMLGYEFWLTREQIVKLMEDYKVQLTMTNVLDKAEKFWLKEKQKRDLVSLQKTLPLAA